MGREAAERWRALSLSSDSDFESPEEKEEERSEEREEREEEEEEREDDDNTSRETHRMTEEEEEYGGLSAEDLADEKLFAGDTIEYFSMAFVFGDSRGHRVAKVLKISPREREYPLRLDSQEMLPKTLMIKRMLDRRGKELEPGAAVWRKIRTFGLVDGQVKGKTRADILNEGLKSAVSGAFQSVYKPSGKKDNQTKESDPFATFTKPKQTDSFFSGDSGTKKLKSRDREREPATNKDKSTATSKKSTSITSYFAPKGSLESIVTARSSSSSSSSKHALQTTSSSSKSSKSDRSHDTTPSSKVLGKRPRVELTPSPSVDKHRDRDRTNSASPSSPRPHKRKDDRSHRHHDFLRGKREDRRDKSDRPSKKVSLVKYVKDLEEEKNDPGTQLDRYLEIVDEEKAAKEQIKKRKQEDRGIDRSTPSSGGGSSGSDRRGDVGTSRMRASGGGDETRGKEKNRVRMKSLHNYYQGQPRPHPDAQKRAPEKAPGAGKLNFMMGDGGDSSFTRPLKPQDKTEHRSRHHDSKDRRSRESSKSPKKKDP